MVQLIFKSGPQNGSAIKLGPGLNRIGRNADNNIQIADPSISGFHCEMHVSPLGVAFRDVGSSNGSFIEGRRVQKEILTGSKMLQLGAITFLVDMPTAHVTIPHQEKQQEAPANFMPDGTQACQKHADLAATFRCVKCEKTWCAECVRRTGLVGSPNAIYSCTDCGAKCEKIQIADRKEKKSILDQLGDKIRRMWN